MGSKFHRGKNGLEKAIVNRIVEDYTPRLLSSFALTLYSSTDMSIDDIKYTMEQCDQLWRRAQAEGWDIRQNCLELTGIDVMHWREAGNIQYENSGGDQGESRGT